MAQTPTKPRTDKLRLNKQDTAEIISCCERTLDSIPEDVLPRCRLGRAVGFRVDDIESFLSRVASGEVRIGKVNQ